jgi:hypothetical protein
MGESSADSVSCAIICRHIWQTIARKHPPQAPAKIQAID